MRLICRIKNLLLASFLLLGCFVKAQTADSTQIKLQYYKDLFVKGLINNQEYEAMKLKVLGLKVQVNAPNAGDDQQKTAPISRYRQGKTLVNARLVPTFYGSVLTTVIDKEPGASSYKSTLHNYMFGGVQAEVGPSMLQRRIEPDMAFGLEGNSNFFLVPVYAHLNVNIINGKYSPYVHAGFGYADLIARSVNNSFSGIIPVVASNGMLCTAGAWAMFRTVKIFSIGFSVDYRFIYANHLTPATNLNGTLSNENIVTTSMLQQIGARMMLVFY